MKRLLWGLCLILLLTSHVWLKETAVKTTKAEILAKTSSSWDGSALPEYPIGTPEITIVRLTIPPKTMLPLHKHPVMLGAVILKGELTVITEEKKSKTFKPGDSIVEVVNKWHFGKNDGNVPVLAIVFYAGIKGQPITIKKETKEISKK